MKDDNHHYKLFNDYITRWNDAINQKLTTMKSLSSDLKERLFLFDEKQRLIKKKNRKMSQKNAFNSKNVKTSQNFQSSVSVFIEAFALVSFSIDQQIELLQQLQQLVQAFTTQQILQTYRFSHESSHSYVQQFSLSMLTFSHELYFSSFLLSNSIHSAYSISSSNFLNSLSSFYQSTSSSSISSSSSSRNSNSMQIDEDANHLMLEYINWQTRKQFARTNILRTIHTKLHEEMYELKNIRHFKDDNWRQMNVSIDLRRRLSRDVKTFRMKYQRIQHSFVNLSRFFIEREDAIIEKKDNNRRRSNNRKRDNNREKNNNRRRESASEYNSEHSLNVLTEACLRQSFDEESN